jgi:hypothetical protein
LKYYPAAFNILISSYSTGDTKLPRPGKNNEKMLSFTTGVVSRGKLCGAYNRYKKKVFCEPVEKYQFLSFLHISTLHVCPS